MNVFLHYLSDIIGCIGAFIVLVVYALLQMEKMRVQNFLYSFLNLLAAVMIIFSLIEHWNLGAFIMEFIWALVSIYGISKLFFTKPKKSLAR